MTLRIVIVWFALVIGFVHPARAQPTAPRETTTLDVRLYDYAEVTPDTLARAQQMVSEIYREAGIRFTWLPTITLAVLAQRDMSQPLDIGDLSIIVLNRQMSRLKGVRPDALGSAVVSPTERGEIAYVFFDRLSPVAFESSRHEADILALVIAHEIGHLLLPPGAHTSNGVMRGEWSMRELRDATASDFAFTMAQAKNIRHGRFRVAASTVVAERPTTDPIPRLMSARGNRAG